MHQTIGPDQSIVGVGRRHRVAARNLELAACVEEDLRVGASGIDVTAGQHTNVVGVDLDVVAHVDVAVDQHVLGGRLQAQQANFGFTQVALAQHALDEDAVGRGDADGATGGGVERAARHVVVAAVEHQRLHQHGHATGVAAGHDLQLVVGRQQAIDADLGPAGDGNVGAHIGRGDSAAQPDVAVADHPDAALARGQGAQHTIGGGGGFGPGGGTAIKATGGIGPD